MHERNIIELLKYLKFELETVNENTYTERRRTDGTYKREDFSKFV